MRFMALQAVADHLFARLDRHSNESVVVAESLYDTNMNGADVSKATKGRILNSSLTLRT